MKFGIYISYKHAAGDDMRRRTEEHFEQVRVMREVGLDSLWSGQHWVPTPFQMLQPIPFLARAAAEAGEMLIGTNLLLVPFYSPLDVAEVATTMDIVTGGRFLLGIGLGYRDFEFDNLGIRRSERAGRLTETVEILRRLWAGESVTFMGRYYRLKDVALTMRPIQQPHPPILIGANVPAAVRRAGEIGDGWIASGNVSLEALLALRSEYESGRRASRRPAPKERFLFLDVYLSDDRRRAVDEIAPYVKAAYDAFVSWGNVKVERLDVPPEVLAERFVVGDPAYCIERLREYHDRGGFNHVLARVQLPGPGGSLPQDRVLRTIRLLGTEVAPVLRPLP